jgi:hypothetical protein
MLQLVLLVLLLMLMGLSIATYVLLWCCDLNVCLILLLLPQMMFTIAFFRFALPACLTT